MQRFQRIILDNKFFYLLVSFRNTIRRKNLLYINVYIVFQRSIELVLVDPIIFL